MFFFFIMFSVFTIFSILFPLLRGNHWFIRSFDFPRFQITIFVVLYFIFSLVYLDNIYSKIVVTLICIVSFILDLYRIGPYLSFYKVESETSSKPGKHDLKIYSANVFVNNKEYKKLMDSVEKNNPDVILLLEPDILWAKGVEKLTSK